MNNNNNDNELGRGENWEETKNPKKEIREEKLKQSYCTIANSNSSDMNK